MQRHGTRLGGRIAALAALFRRQTRRARREGSAGIGRRADAANRDRRWNGGWAVRENHHQLPGACLPRNDVRRVPAPDDRARAGRPRAFRVRDIQPRSAYMHPRTAISARGRLPSAGRRGAAHDVSRRRTFQRSCRQDSPRGQRTAVLRTNVGVSADRL